MSLDTTANEAFNAWMARRQAPDAPPELAPDAPGQTPTAPQAAPAPVAAPVVPPSPVDQLQAAQEKDQADRQSLARRVMLMGSLGNGMDPQAVKLLAPRAAENVEAVPSLREKSAKAAMVEADVPYAGATAKAKADLEAAHAQLFGQQAQTGAAAMADAERVRQDKWDPNGSSTQVARGLMTQAGMEPPPGPYGAWEHLLPEAVKMHIAAVTAAARPIFAVNPTTGATYDKRTGKPSGSVPPSPSVPDQAPAQPGAIGPLEPSDKRLSKLSGEFKKDMDAAAASSRSAFGSSANVIFRGARNLAILDQKNPDGTQRQLTGPEWQEVSGGLIAMQTGGVPTERMMQEGLPKDIKGDAAHIMSWLTSAPTAPDRQEWIDRFRANIDREEQTALKFQHQTQMQRIPSHSEFFSLFPNRAKLAAKGYGIDPALIDQVRSGKFETPSDKGAASATGNGSDAAAALRKKYGL